MIYFINESNSDGYSSIKYKGIKVFSYTNEATDSEIKNALKIANSKYKEASNMAAEELFDNCNKVFDEDEKKANNCFSIKKVYNTMKFNDCAYRRMGNKRWIIEFGFTHPAVDGHTAVVTLDCYNNSNIKIKCQLEG